MACLSILQHMVAMAPSSLVAEPPCSLVKEVNHHNRLTLAATHCRGCRASGSLFVLNCSHAAVDGVGLARVAAALFTLLSGGKLLDPLDCSRAWVGDPPLAKSKKDLEALTRGQMPRGGGEQDQQRHRRARNVHVLVAGDDLLPLLPTWASTAHNPG